MPPKTKLPEAEWNFTSFYGPGKEDFRKLLYYYEFGREYYNREHENNEKRYAEIVEFGLKNPGNNDLPEFDDAFAPRTPAAQFIRELAREIEAGLPGRHRLELHFLAFRQTPFCALKKGLQNRILKVYKNPLGSLTKDRVSLRNYGSQIPSPDMREKFKGIEKVFVKGWKELGKQILNEKDQNLFWVISPLDLRNDDRIIESQFKYTLAFLEGVRKDRKIEVLNTRRRGKKNYTSDLKNLAAARALKHYDDDVWTAKEKTEGINKKGEKTPIYVRNDDWLKTPEIVESVLKELFN